MAIPDSARTPNLDRCRDQSHAYDADAGISMQAYYPSTGIIRPQTPEMRDRFKIVDCLDDPG